jgi:hypothetical protein
LRHWARKGRIEQGNRMDFAYVLERVWDFVQWFAGLVISTVDQSIYGGWNAVIALAAVAVVLFLITRGLFHRGER